MMNNKKENKENESQQPEACHSRISLAFSAQTIFSSF
jgi:hypothetical protein